MRALTSTRRIYRRAAVPAGLSPLSSTLAFPRARSSGDRGAPPEREVAGSIPAGRIRAAWPRGNGLKHGRAEAVTRARERRSCARGRHPDAKLARERVREADRQAPTAPIPSLRLRVKETPERRPVVEAVAMADDFTVRHHAGDVGRVRGAGREAQRLLRGLLVHLGSIRRTRTRAGIRGQPKSRAHVRRAGPSHEALYSTATRRWRGVSTARRRAAEHGTPQGLRVRRQSATRLQLTCIFIDRDYRRKDLTSITLHGALDLIAQRRRRGRRGLPGPLRRPPVGNSFLYDSTRALRRRAALATSGRRARTTA